MTWVASLYLPQLPIERLRRQKRSARPPEPGAGSTPALPAPVDDDPGACSVPRGGGWRPGALARWARDGALAKARIAEQVATLPAQQRPPMRKMGRRSEPAQHPFRAMPPDEGIRSAMPMPASTWGTARPVVLIARVGHPVSFLREQLDEMRIARCADLASIPDGRNIEVAGVILVRQRSGFARGVLFITIEDETGIVNGILWPNRFDIYRRQVMSSSMIAMRGRLQKEGEVIHIICDRITDHDDRLRSIGRTSFTVSPGRGDGASSGGGPDPRDPTLARRRTLASPPYGMVAQEQLVRVRSHNFR